MKVSEEVSRVMSEMAKKRWRKTTKKQRVENAKKMVQARIDKVNLLKQQNENLEMGTHEVSHE